MNSATGEDIAQCQQGNSHYLWNTRLIDAVDADMFEPKAWQAANRLAGQASGRGAAYFLRPEQGGAWVLRHSRRGGIIAHVSTDRYCWLGLKRCRVIQEFRLLNELYRRGLPVPEPVAARVVRYACSYTGDLITVQIDNARPLADWLQEQPLDNTIWQRIGATIARFHAVGVYHHDLNARNILVDDEQHITLIDFDKSGLRHPGRWQQQNLARLRRSLDKFASRQPTFNFSAADWQPLLAGYNAT